jgi:MoxR-like ATPase
MLELRVPREGVTTDTMAAHDFQDHREPPPEIDCDAPVKLVDRPELPEQYHQFEPESALAIQAALGACRPLLVRGEPGVGKTQLAAAAARVLGRPLVQKVVEARTESRDLLWEYDAVLRLAEAQVAGAIGSLAPGQHAGDFASGHPGESLKSLRESVQERLATERFVRPGPLWWAFDWENARDQARLSRSPEPNTDGADPAKGCVVLIDEIDKADSDVPNGLLEALGAGEFTPLGRTKPVKVTGRFPLVIITTNEERVLPGAFVRRCLVLHLRLPPDENALTDFLVDRAKVHFPRKDESEQAQQAFENSVVLFRRVADVLVEDRQAARERGISPLPGQAEYLDLVRALRAMEPDSPESQLVLLEKVKAFALRKNEAP